jgi:transcriptional regulator with XRE-family HTH domain
MRARALIGWNTRRLRIRRGETQEVLGDRSGLGHAHIGRIERGLTNVSADSLDKLALALGVKLTDLFVPKRAKAREPAPLKKGPKTPSWR